MIYIGVSNLLKVYFLGFNIVSILGAMFFIVPGVIFLTLFFERGRSGALFPASFMIWFGVFIIVSGISFIRINGFSLLLAFSGLAFYTIALLGKKKWAFSVGTALVILSIIFMGLFGKLIASIIGLSQLFAVALILLSLVMIIRALIKRKE